MDGLMRLSAFEVHDHATDPDRHNHKGKGEGINVHGTPYWDTLWAYAGHRPV